MTQEEQQQQEQQDGMARFYMWMFGKISLPYHITLYQNTLLYYYRYCIVCYIILCSQSVVGRIFLLCHMVAGGLRGVSGQFTVLVSVMGGRRHYLMTEHY